MLLYREFLMDCRFYNKALPEVEDVVLVQVKSLSDIGAYVTLLEYGKVEGMIQISEMSNRRIRSISKLTRAGNVEVCLVLRVDADRGYIDLSKRRVVAEEGIKAREQYARAKTVHGIMRHVATIVKDRSLADICGYISWPLYKNLGAIGTYEVLRRIVNENSTAAVCEIVGDEVPTDVLEALMVAASRKLTPHEVRVRAIFDCTCFTTEGVLAIREALTAVKAQSEKDIVLKLISAPQFLVETSGIGREACTARVCAALALVEKEITARGGNYKLRSPPDIIGEDEEELPKIEQDVSSDEEEEDEANKPKKSSSDSDDSESSSSSSSSSEDEAPRKGKKKNAHKRK